MPPKPPKVEEIASPTQPPAKGGKPVEAPVVTEEKPAEQIFEHSKTYLLVKISLSKPIYLTEDEVVIQPTPHELIP